MPDRDKIREQPGPDLGEMGEQVAGRSPLIAKHKQMEKALAKLLELGRVMVTTHQVDVVLDQAVKSAVDITTVADRGSIQLLAEGDDTLRTVAVSGDDDRLWHIIPFRAGIGVAGQALASGRIFNVPDVLEDEHFIPGKLPSRFRSLLVAPLVAKGQLLGTLSLSSERVAAFSEQDETLIQLIADQTAVALENARLITSRKQAEETLRVAVLGTAGVTGVDFFRSLVNHLATALGARYVFVGELVVLEKDQLNTLAFWADGILAENITYGLAGTPCEKIVAREICYYPQHVRTFFPKDKLLVNLQIESYLGAPLFNSANKLLGFLVVMHDQALKETLNSRAILNVFATRAGAELERQQVEMERELLLEAEQRQTEVARTLSSALDLPTILPNVVRLSAELVGAEAGALALIRPDGEAITYPYLFNLPENLGRVPRARGEGLGWHIIETNQPLLLASYQAHERALPHWVKAGVQACMGVPVMAGQNQLGVLALFNLTPGKAFNERDLALVEAVGGQTGIAVQNARQYAEEQQRARALTVALARQEELDWLKSEFIRNLSHELRTPLTIARGYTELFEGGDLGELQPDQEKAVKVMARRMRMLSDLVNDLVAISTMRERPLKREAINLSGLAQSLLNDFQIIASQGDVVLTAEITPNLLLTSGDPVRLWQVLDKLLSNAFKFTPANGTITTRLWQSDSKAILEVSDTGIGIPTDQLKHVFERFYQVDSSPTRRYGGAGLGLALAKEIVEAHGGEVTVRSVEGQGSTFQVILPGVATSE